MSDKLQWFKFHPSDWMMGRIRKLDKETQADFISLVCIYWNNECTLTVEDAELEIGEDALTKLVKYKIVKKDSDSIGIHFLDEQWNEIDEKTDHQSRSGQLGNLKRWHPMLYSRVMKGELSIEDAYAMAKESAPDHLPIDPQSRIIADKIREDKEESRKEKRGNAQILEANQQTKETIRAWLNSNNADRERLIGRHKINLVDLKEEAERLFSHYDKQPKRIGTGPVMSVLDDWLNKGKDFKRNGRTKEESTKSLPQSREL